jgi:hypothetical protein
VPVQGTPPRAATVSPDGTETVSSKYESDPSLDPAKSVVYIEKKGGGSTAVAHGVGPGFLDATHVLYFGAKGATILDLSSNTEKLIYPMATSSMPFNVNYSPDRTLVAWSEGSTGNINIARISADSFQLLHVFVGLHSAVISNKALYSIAPLKTETQLWRYGLDGASPKRVLTFPASFAGIRYIAL